MKCDVYKNLNRECLSVRSRESDEYGRVVDHRDSVVVDNVEFVVQPAGRERVLEEERKNVHAFVRGRLSDDQSWRPVDGVEITYNPYEFDSFVTTDGHTPVDCADRVVVNTDGVCAIGVA